ncbi:hypothetical protein BpHYR1_044540 [Brachionus plicatilis]|uniref:Uncharacterized protein n=1 Tax=Brachionus plicatilis TaxID=10195 RepID=A0A3M7R231_BRAPC|nr:hypothetical protein BpHYR1_044540 [Brachionus plicatilis]
MCYPIAVDYFMFITNTVLARYKLIYPIVFLFLFELNLEKTNLVHSASINGAMLNKNSFDDLFADLQFNVAQKKPLPSRKKLAHNKIIADLVVNLKPEILNDLLSRHGGRILYEQDAKMDLDPNSLFIMEEIPDKKLTPLPDSLNMIENEQFSTTSFYMNSSSSALSIITEEAVRTSEQISQSQTILSTTPTDPSVTSTTTATTTKSVSYPNNPQFVECINSCGTDHDCVRTKCLLDSTYFG